MWAQTGKRSINRHVFCCILTMMVKTYLLVRVVPNHSSKGADGVCWERTALQKPCLSPQSQILRAPKLGQAQSAGCDPFIPAPLALPKKHSQLFLLLLSPCKVPAVKDRSLGELDLFVPAHQRSLLPKAHVPTLPWRATIHPCNSWVKTRGTKWLGSDQPVRSRTRNTINPVLVPAVPALIVSWRHFASNSGKKPNYCAPKWLGSKHKTLYCYSQIHTSNTCSSFLWQSHGNPGLWRKLRKMDQWKACPRAGGHMCLYERDKQTGRKRIIKWYIYLDNTI